MEIIEAFKAGKIGVESSIPNHVITAISNVFVFENKAYKIYKNDNQFFNEHFNNLSTKEGRFMFTGKDFNWNHELSPEIYVELRGVRIENNLLVWEEPLGTSDELVVIMNKIDMADGLLNKLIDERINKEDCYKIGYQLGERLIRVKKNFPIAIYDDFIARYKDLDAWLVSVKEIPQDRVRNYLDYIKNFIESHKEDFDRINDQMGICLDVHADNAIYSNGVFLPIDSYAPKEDWLHGYKFISVYRVATDIYAFLGKEHFEEVLRGYSNATNEKLPREWDDFMVIYCELIVWPYQYMLSEKDTWRLDIAKKYEEFIDKLFSSMNKSIL